MATDIDVFVEGFNTDVNTLFYMYAAKRGVKSVSTIADLGKLGLTDKAFIGSARDGERVDVKIDTTQQKYILNAFRRGGVVEGLMALRSRNSDFIDSTAEGPAEAFKSAGVIESFFNKYDSMEMVQEGMKKLAGRVEDGKITKAQFFKAATAVAYVSHVYKASEGGIKYLTQFHDYAIPYFKGVVQLKKDGTAAFKDNYNKMFEALGVDTERLSEIISGKEIPEELTHESGYETKLNYNLKKYPIQRLTTNGMKQFALAGDQAYSLIVSDLITSEVKDRISAYQAKKAEIIESRADDDESSLTDEQIAQRAQQDYELNSILGKQYDCGKVSNFIDRADDNLRDVVLSFLSRNGENSVDEVAGFLTSRIKGVGEVVKTALQINPGIDQAVLIQNVVEAAVSTGAFAAETDTDFMFKLSKGCAKSPELKEMFKDLDPIQAGFLYHEGEVYSCEVDKAGTTITEKEFESIKGKIEGKELEAGGSVDLKEARLDNFVVNPNPCAAAAAEMHADLLKAEKEEEAEQVERTFERSKDPGGSTSGLYRSLTQYSNAVGRFMSYYERYGIEIPSMSQPTPPVPPLTPTP